MDPIKPLLGDYLDRELSPAEVLRVESHLGECNGCRAALDELKALSNMIGGLPKAALPAGFMDRLERRRTGLRPASASAAWRLPVGARTVGFAFASLLAAVVVYDKIKLVSPIQDAASSLPALPAALSDDQLRLNPLTAKEKAPDGAGLSAADASKTTFAKKAVRARAPGAPIGVVEEDKVAAANAPVPAAAAVPEITNEELQRGLEREKRLMGVRRIVEPERHPMGQFAAVGAGGANVQQLNAAPPAAALGGEVAALLKAETAATGAAAVRGAAAAPPPPAPAAAEGVVVRSEDERAKLWAARQMTLSPPRVDYVRQMLVVVFGPMDSGVEVADVRLGLDGLHIRYRLIELPEGASRSTQAPPYQFRVVPLTDKPVSFDVVP